MIIFLSFLVCDFANIWMVSLIYFREASIETLRTIAAKKKIVISARTSGKIKTAIQIGGAIVIVMGSVIHSLIPKLIPSKQAIWSEIYFYYPYTIMTIITVVTILSGIDYFKSYISLILSKD